MKSDDIRKHESMRSSQVTRRLGLACDSLLPTRSFHCSCQSVPARSRHLRPQNLQEPSSLAENWKLTSASNLRLSGAAISLPDYKDTGWHAIRRMPATVLEILEEDGVYPNLYVGKNMAENVPQDLYKQDWWYRTTFEAPSEHSGLFARVSRHQLPCRDLAEWPSDRGQQARRRHVRRARTQCDTMDQAGAAQYACGKSHTGTSDSGCQRH